VVIKILGDWSLSLLAEAILKHPTWDSYCQMPHREVDYSRSGQLIQNILLSVSNDGEYRDTENRASKLGIELIGCLVMYGQKSREKTSDMAICHETINKRVGTITMFHNSTNYGGVLQAYALHKAIQNLGFKCSTIRYSENKSTATINSFRGLLESDSNLERILKICGTCARVIKYASRRALKKLVKRAFLNQKMVLRENAFSAFNREHIQSTGPYTSETIDECLDDYDIFVCGSDRIWNPKRITLAYFLDFVPEDKLKIAYAPSIASNALTDSEKILMRPLVNRLNAISVREKQGKEQLEMLTDKRVNWVLDPTLLLEYDEWNGLCKPYPIKTPYIFCYILGKDKKNKQFIINIAEKLSLPTVSIPFVAGDNFTSLTYGDIGVYDAGPGQFLSLIQNAEYVITDSFHGSIFSIIFKKKFFLLKRSDIADRSSMNSRLHELIETCQLGDRLICNTASINSINFADEIDYETVWANLNEKRKQSWEYLIQSLSMGC